MVDPQVSSLNLLKAQRARKLEAANTAASSRCHVHKDRGKTLADSSLRSPTPKATGSRGSPESENSDQLNWDFGGEENEQRSSLDGLRQPPVDPSLQHTANGYPGQVPPRNPSSPSHGGVFTPPHSSNSTSQIHHVRSSQPSESQGPSRPPLRPVQAVQPSELNPRQSSQHHSSPASHPGRHPLAPPRPRPVQQSQPSREKVPHHTSSPVRHPGRRPQAKVLPPALQVCVNVSQLYNLYFFI